ncbi:hypothetical protein AVEN_66892-1, partial [Araneus ventricosus]
MSNYIFTYLMGSVNFGLDFKLCKCGKPPEFPHEFTDEKPPD